MTRLVHIPPTHLVLQVETSKGPARKTPSGCHFKAPLALLLSPLENIVRRSPTREVPVSVWVGLDQPLLMSMRISSPRSTVG